MKINQKIMLSIVASIFLFYCIGEVSTYFLNLESLQKKLYVKNKVLVQTVKQMQSDTITSISLLLANDAIIKKGYIENNPQIIIDHLNQFWEKAKKAKIIHEIHFFKPPAQSFVNFSNFKSIGQDVSDARPDIQWVTSSFNNSTHTMMCKTYAGLRATFPIVSDDGKMLGGLSLGKKINWLPHTMKEISKSDAFLVFNKQSTQSLTPKYYNNFMKDKELMGEFILGDKTTKVPLETIKKIDFSKHIQNLELNGKSYSLNIFKMENFHQNILGYLCILNDLEHFHEEFFYKVLKNIFILLIASLTVYFLLKNRVIKIIERINYLKNITRELKGNNFHILDSVNVDNKSSLGKNGDELSELQFDIIAMGKSLETHYRHLEDEVHQRTLELEYEKNYLNNILDGTPDIIIVTHGSKLMSANKSFFDFVECDSLESFLEQYECISDYFLLCNGELFSQHKTIENTMWSVYIAQNQEKEFQVVLEKESTLYYFTLKAVFLTETEILITLHNITQQRKKEKILQKQSRLAQMGEMISMIAHQWRQPLGAISATVGHLEFKIDQEVFDLDTKEGQVEQNEDFKKRLKKIRGFVSNLTATIDDFRNFYKPNKESVITSFEQITTKALSIVETSLVNDNIEIVYNYHSHEKLAIYDREMMQVVLNILKNAQDNFKEKKVLNPKITITTEKKSLSICDNGGGIPDEIMDRIFDPYFSTKDEKNGTGLGLYMSKTIIEEHHKGKLDVQNRDNGVCFVINLESKNGNTFKA